MFIQLQSASGLIITRQINPKNIAFRGKNWKK